MMLTCAHPWGSCQVFCMSLRTSSMSTVCRVREMWSHRITNVYISKPTHELAVPNLMWMSQYFNTSANPYCIRVSNGINSMSLSCRVQEIWSHKITNAHCKNKIVVLTICLVTTIVCDCPSYNDSKNVALVKHFVGS